MSMPSARARGPDRPRRSPEAVLEPPARDPTAKRATRWCRTSCSTGSRPRSSSPPSTGRYSFWLGTDQRGPLPAPDPLRAPLLFLYVPSVERAYHSVKDIEYVVTFGSWIRSVHRLSAHLMVAAVFLHLVRVFLTGAYKNGIGRGQRREWNWVHRRGDAAPHPVPVLHRVPAALGPARLLGGHGGHQHRVVDPLRGSGDPRAADRRSHHRAADPDPLLRAAHHRPARCPRHALRVPHVAGAQGRRARPRRPRGPSRRDGGRAARPRPRPTRSWAWPGAPLPSSAPGASRLPTSP